jgi:transcriptional regulator with XRE-family HTH domain
MSNPTKTHRPRARPSPEDWYRPVAHAAVQSRDFTGLFRYLQKMGYSQARLGALTDQSQPEISAVIHGRRIMAYDVMKRVAHGLGIPLCLMGLASCGACVHHIRASGLLAIANSSERQSGDLRQLTMPSRAHLCEFTAPGDSALRYCIRSSVTRRTSVL